MTADRDNAGLAWIRSALGESLDAARLALEAFDAQRAGQAGKTVAGDVASVDLADCTAALHRVHGALVMIQFDGAATFAGILEDAVGALAEGWTGVAALPDSAGDDAGRLAELVMQGLLELADYLDAPPPAGSDDLAPLLPLLNEIRVALGREIQPVAVAAGSVLADFHAASGPERVRRLRGAYQQLLLGVFRSGLDHAVLAGFRKVAQGIARLCPGSPQGTLWLLFERYLDVVAAAGGIGEPPDAGTTRVLRRLDAELRALIVDEATALARPLPVEPAVLMVERIERAGGADAWVATVARSLAALQSPGALSRSGERAMSGAALALREEIALLRDQLASSEPWVAGEVGERDTTPGDEGAERHREGDRIAAVATVQRIISVLSALGLESARIPLERLLSLLSGMDHAGRPMVPESVEHAGNAAPERLSRLLDEVDAQLKSLVQKDYRVGERSLGNRDAEAVTTARRALEHLEDAVVEYVGGSRDRQLLIRLPGLLAPLPALLRPWLPALAEVLARCEVVAVRWVQQSAGLRSDDLDRFADVISAATYYLERVLATDSGPAEAVLGIAWQNLAALDDGIEPEQEPEQELEQEPEQGSEREQEPRKDSEESLAPVVGSAPPASERLAECLETSGSAAAVDEDILEVFIEEVDELLGEVDDHLARWQTDLADVQAITGLRRAFHTLKGSGRLVGAAVFGELAWSIERLLNRVLENAITPVIGMTATVAMARARLPLLRDAFLTGDRPELEPVALLMAEVDRLRTGTDVQAQGVVGQSPESTRTADDSRRQPASLPESTGIPAPTPAQIPEQVGKLELIFALVPEHDIGPVHDDALDTAGPNLPLFLSEAKELLALIAPPLSIDRGDQHGATELDPAEGRGQSPVRLDAAMVRALHTLTGAAASIGETAIADVARAALGVMAQRLGVAREVRLDARDAAFLASVHDALVGAVEALATGAQPTLPVSLRETAAELLSTVQPESLVERVLGLDGLDQLFDARAAFAAWNTQAFEPGLVGSLIPVLTRLRDLARAATHDELGDLADDLAGELAALPATGPATLAAGVSDRLCNSHEALLAAIDALVAAQAAEPAPIELTQAPPASEDRDEGEATDAELRAVFLDEADALLAHIEAAVGLCGRGSDVAAAVAALRRNLHTLKGSARLAGFDRAGDIAHAFETTLEDIDPAAGPLAPAIALALETHLADLVSALAPFMHRRVHRASVGIEPLAADTAGDDQPVSSMPAETETRAGVSGATVAVALHEDLPVLPEARANIPLPDSEMATDAVVRVRTGLLDELVDLVGESSVLRGRIQQHLVDVGGALAEMEATVRRLRDQMRRLEVEVEARMPASDRAQERSVEAPSGAGARPAAEGFDALELDRFTELQSLVRALSETTADVLDLNEVLHREASATDGLLVQQGRIQARVRDELEHARRVPVTELLGRLRRVVGQTARELGKSAELVVSGAELELERSLLDRLAAPLEHILRNAVDHGIEAAADRLAAGKDTTGRISLRVGRDGGQVLLEIRDDGAGIDLARVRERAVAAGLLAADADPGSEAMAQLVFVPGLSTARSLTAISGRGVGLDSAAAAISEIGGRIEVASTRGQGATFTIRLASATGVQRGILVEVGDERYVAPLASLVGVVSTSAARLSAPGASQRWFRHADADYEVRDLAACLGVPASAREPVSAVPLLLVKHQGRAVAFRADAVSVTQEIVPRSLGPRFDGVVGVAGATVLGDGAVVVVLDLAALADLEAPLVSAPPAAGGMPVPASVRDDEPLRVLVVDDSVTVRKVTARVLAQAGLVVTLARDGLEALDAVATARPDVVLLDIEMPRMDGFEVLERLRADPAQADLPVIMISSRTGARHREHAARLGVTDFIGKPFQEEALIALIRSLAAATPAAAVERLTAS